MIQSGRYKKIIVIGADKMSSVVDYTDRSTCPLFGDGAAAVLVEATTEEGVGLVDSHFRTDGKGLPLPPCQGRRVSLPAVAVHR